MGVRKKEEAGEGIHGQSSEPTEQYRENALVREGGGGGGEGAYIFARRCIFFGTGDIPTEDEATKCKLR